MRLAKPHPTGRQWLLFIGLLLWLAGPVIVGAKEGEWLFAALFVVCMAFAVVGFWTGRFR